jgi:hypothetical protein
MKHCTRCGQVKQLTDFYKRSSATDGRQGWCKDCARAALDAADARRKARRHQPAATDWATLAALLVERIDDVIELFNAVTETGEVDVFGRLADRLCPNCPRAREDYDGPPCWLHDDWAVEHINVLVEQHPSAVALLSLDWQQCFALNPPPATGTSPAT